MSAPKVPPDNSMAIKQMEMQAQREAEQKRADEAAAEKTRLAGLRTTAGQTGRTNAMNYFTQQGVDPNAYSTDIDAAINAVLGGIAENDPNPGSYFNNIGANAFNSTQDAYRAKSDRALNSYFTPNWENNRVAMTLDDPYLASIDAEQRASADQIIKNMLSRGVITDTGFAGASADLDKQGAGVRAKLDEVGTTNLMGERGALRDIGNKARQDAQNLTLGSPFDANSYSGQADQNFNDWFAGLGDALRASAPGNLYNTAGLGALAGAAQGAQNLPFDPNATQAIDPDATDEEKTTKKAAIF